MWQQQIDYYQNPGFAIQLVYNHVQYVDPYFGENAKK